MALSNLKSDKTSTFSAEFRLGSRTSTPNLNLTPNLINCLVTAKITSFSKCLFLVYLIPWWNLKISLYLVWKSIICSTKSLLNHPYIYFLKGEIHVLNLNRISVIRIDSSLIFASQNWFVEIKTRSTTFIFWPPQDYQPFEIKTAMNALSFVILDCRKRINSYWLSRLLIGSRTWSK